MTHDYRETKAWQAALELGPRLMSLADDLPATEAMGLSWQLRHLAVDLPAVVADDLMRDRQTRRLAILRLLTALELIDRVYPALDTVSIKRSTESLAELLTGEEFEITEPTTPATIAPAAAAAAAVAASEVQPAEPDDAPGVQAAASAVEQPTATRLSIPVQAEGNTVTESDEEDTEESDVLPNRPQ